MHGRINTHIIKKLIIPDNIIVNILNNNICIFKEYKNNNTIEHNINKYISINIENDTIILSAILDKTTKNIKILALINTTYILFKNYFKGLTTPFSKTLILKGVGYKADYQKNILKLFIGFSHPIIFNIPDDINVTLATVTTICISGISKSKVGQISHEIKMKRPVEIYKGNGIRYKDEIIKLKSAKKTK